MTQLVVSGQIDHQQAIELFQKLPQEERLRVEGIIVGLTLARSMEKPYTDGKRATK